MKSRLQFLTLTVVLGAMLFTGAMAVVGNYYIQLRGDELRAKAHHYRQMSGFVTKMRDIALHRLIALQEMLIEPDPFERDELVLAHMELAGEFIVTRKALGRLMRDDDAVVHGDEEMAYLAELQRFFYLTVVVLLLCSAVGIVMVRRIAGGERRLVSEISIRKGDGADLDRQPCAGWGGRGAAVRRRAGDRAGDS